MLIAAVVLSPVPAAVGTTGTTVGFVPQCSPTALEQSTATKATLEDDDFGPRSIHDPDVQMGGGFLGGLALGYVPIAGPAVSLLADANVLPSGTREARIGRAIGEMLGGLLLT